MNKYIKVLSIALSLTSASFLPNAVATEQTAKSFDDLVKVYNIEAIVKTMSEDSSESAWPKDGGLQF